MRDAAISTILFLAVIGAFVFLLGAIFRSCEAWGEDCARHGGHIEGEIGVNAKCVGANR